jgi:hypothetical protein
MTKSERIKLIHDIAIVLSKEDWSIIDLTLDQFGFPTSITYNSSEFNYVIEHVKGGSNIDLVELGRHVGLILHRESASQSPKFWKDNYFRIFISHLSEDKELAEQLKLELETYGITGFVAHTDIEPTLEWQMEIELALNTCDCLVALISHSFNSSNWTDQEIGMALGRGHLVIPVKLGKDPYGFIGKYQAISNKDVPALANSIFLSIQRNKISNEKMAMATISKFENSESYRSAQYNLSLVEQNTFWNKSLAERLLVSIDKNPQIKDSWGVPEKIQLIISNSKQS